MVEDDSYSCPFRRRLLIQTYGCISLSIRSPWTMYEERESQSISNYSAHVRSSFTIPTYQDSFQDRDSKLPARVSESEAPLRPEASNPTKSHS